MKVVLTSNPADLGHRLASSDQCDCDCACPAGEIPLPVMPIPISYYLELEADCNNNCPGCGNVYAQDRKRDLSPPLGWESLIERLSEHSTHFKLTGGEPTLHPAFASIVQTLRACSVPFTLFTNGRWNRPQQLLQTLVDSVLCEGLLISLHGPDAAAHERFSGIRGSFQQTATNIRQASEAGLDVAISTVISRANWDRLPETLELALELGANQVVCNRFIGHPAANIAPDTAQLRAAIRSVERLRERGSPIRFGNCIPRCFEPSSSMGCAAGTAFATIDPWGNMRPCNHAPLVAGSLLDRSVVEVWHSEEMDRWRAMVPQECEGCALLTSCHGGCRAQAMLSGLAQDPLISGPLPKQAERTLQLYEGLRPLLHCEHRKWETIQVLVRRGRMAAVQADQYPLLQELDAPLTLRQIEQRHGSDALELLGSLQQAGLVTWKQLESELVRTT